MEVFFNTHLNVSSSSQKCVAAYCQQKDMFVKNTCMTVRLGEIGDHLPKRQLNEVTMLCAL